MRPGRERLGDNTNAPCLAGEDYPICMRWVTIHDVAVSGSWDVIFVLPLTHLPRMVAIVAMRPPVVLIFAPLHI